MSEVARITAYTRRFYDACSERIVDVDGGTAYLSPSFPSVYDLNLVLFDAFEGRPARALIGETEAALDEFGHRRFYLLESDESEGERIASEVGREEGWSTSRLVDMVWRGAPPAEGRTATAEEMSLAEIRDFRAEQVRRAPYGSNAEVVRQLVAKDARYAAAVESRFFGVRASDRVVSALNLFLLDGIAEIDDVSTDEAARGKGYATATVEAAVRAGLDAGAEFVFLCAEEDDWPKDFYARLGFEVVARRYEFTRLV